MKIKNSLLIFLLLAAGLAVMAQKSVANKIHLGLVTPLSTQGWQARDISPVFALHILQGVNYDNKGAAIAGLTANLQGSNRGVMVSGLVNTVKGSDKGVAIAGLLNSAGNGRGVQVAGLHNQQNGNGFIQVAGLSNYSKYEALQVAGLVNISGDAGVQIAGLVNIANHCDYPIGLINIIKNGEQQIGVQVYDDASANLLLRTGGRKTYGIIGAGVGREMKRSLLQMEAGIGYRIPLSASLRINAEAVAISKTDFSLWKHTQSLRALLGYKVLPGVELTVGPAVNTYKYSDSKIFPGKYIWKIESDTRSFALTLGAAAGININL